MQRSAIFMIMITVAAAVAHAQDRFRTYSNDRFFYSIEYPSAVLKMQPPPTNNDGRTFVSADRRTEMRVWASHNVLGRDLVEEFEDALKRCRSAKPYKDFRERYFVFSCRIGDRIFYQKTMHRGDHGPEVLFTFTIEYPSSQKKKFDRLVTRISRSFRFDPDAGN